MQNPKNITANVSSVAFDDIERLSGTEYLARVATEAKKLPQVCVSSSLLPSPVKKRKFQSLKLTDNGGATKIIPIDGSAASLAYLVSKRACLTPPPSKHHLPSVSPYDWTNAIVASFENLRYYLERCKAQGIGGKESKRIPVPPMKDRSSWHVFCTGMEEANGNVGAYFGGDDDGDTEIEEEDDEEDQTAQWRVRLPTNGYAPSVRLLLQMDQVMVRCVLSHLAHYIHLGWSIQTDRRLEWVYALLAMLEKPVHRDDAAVLFGLLKDLTSARAAVDCENERHNLGKLNVLIALVGVFFEQGGGIAGVMTFNP